MTNLLNTQKRLSRFILDGRLAAQLDRPKKAKQAPPLADLAFLIVVIGFAYTAFLASV